MSVVIVIPARYASSRYPGKPLAALRGADGTSKTLIHRAWDAACAVKGIDRVVIATDDARIESAAHDFGAEVIMTPESCANGTERCAAALESLGSPEIVVNLQGDAPLTPAWFVEALVDDLRQNPAHDVATPVLRADGATLASLLTDRRAGRVGGTTAVFGTDRRALYFSKEVIPHLPDSYADDTATETPVWHHVGVYAYRKEPLLAYPSLAPGQLERLEGLEQLRFLEHGHAVLCTPVDAQGRQFWELNNPEDVPKIEAMMSDMGMA